MSAVFNVVGIAGSLRRGSYNRALLRAATEIAPPALHIVVHELDGIPLFNADVEAAGVPESVAGLREAIRQADGLLIATPEYNHGVPGVMKNTIDWLSRPPRDSVMNGKVAPRGQSQLRQAFEFTNTYSLLQPEVLVGRAHEKFDADGRLADQATRAFLAKFLQSFANFMGRFASEAVTTTKGAVL